MKILVTGANGFVASHLIAELAGNHEIIPATSHPSQVRVGFEFREAEVCDITDSAQVDDLVERIQPQAVVHLAAISHVVQASQQRQKLSEVNIIGTHNLCSALQNLPEVLFLFVSTGLVFGGENPSMACGESASLSPNGAYAHTKLAGEELVRSFASDNFHPYIVRPFNHIGPGQSPDFVCAALARRVAQAPQGGMIEIGNLDAKRDFSDVRDIVRAYRLILEKRPEERTFVLGSGQAVTIRSVLESLMSISEKSLRSEVKEQLLRPSDDKARWADASQAFRVLGWKPVIPLERTLRDIYADAVSQVNPSQD